MQVHYSGDDPARLEAGLTALVRDGIYSQALGVLSGGALLTGCALSLGASSLFIGFLSAIPFFAQIAQIPAVILIERIRRRKAICVLVTLIARLLLLPLAVVPLIPSQSVALTVLMACFLVVAPLAAIGGCAWMSWTCDLIPRERLGQVFSRRQLRANVSGIAAGLIGAALVGGGGRWWPHEQAAGYVGVFVLAIASAMASTWYLTRMPDVAMPPRPRVHPRTLFAKPFADLNFRRLMTFLGMWNVAVNLALPFFTVYLVEDLGYGVTTAVVLTVVAQVAYIATLPSWGRLSDRYSNKTVISLCGPIVLFCLLGWILAAQPGRTDYTLPLLAILQVVLGLATSGLDLACNNITFKVAPRGEATVYLGANGLLKSVCAGVAPIASGMLIDDLSRSSVHSLLHRTSVAGSLLDVRPWHVLFLAAFILGIAALAPLRRMEEPGEVGLRTAVASLCRRLGGFGARRRRAEGGRSVPRERTKGAPAKLLPPTAFDPAGAASRSASSFQVPANGDRMVGFAPRSHASTPLDLSLS